MQNSILILVMPCSKDVFQTWNPIGEAWVKFIKDSKGAVRIIDQKQHLPKIPFKNIPVRARPKTLSVDMLGYKKKRRR